MYRGLDIVSFTIGEVAEWSIASDLKSDEVKASGSSNLPFSAISSALYSKSTLSGKSTFYIYSGMPDI